MQRSRALVVLCSPAAKASPWVDKEIRAFRALYGDDRIFAALARGAPADAFPNALVEGHEPLWADLRKSGRAVADERLRLIAAILGLSFDALKQRDVARRRARIVRAIATCAIAAVVAFLYVLTLRSNPVTMALAWSHTGAVPTDHTWNDTELFRCPDCYYETNMTAAASAGKVYLLGGSANVPSFESGASTCFVLSSAHAFEPGTGHWTRLPPMPTARSDFGAAFVDGVLYAAGGNVPQATGPCKPTAAVEAFDPKTGSWSAKAPMPEPRAGFAAVAMLVRGRAQLFVFGGIGANGKPSTTTYAYDPQSNRWLGKAALPHPGAVVTGASAGGKVYAIGALGDPIYNALESYDPAKDAWAEGEKVQWSEDYENGQWFATAYAPGARVWQHPHAAVAGSDIYVLEGGSGDSRSYADASNLDIYHPLTGRWSSAPSLPVSPSEVIATAALGDDYYAYTFAIDFDARSYAAAWKLTPRWIR